jgi:hypothetical protein
LSVPFCFTSSPARNPVKNYSGTRLRSIADTHTKEAEAILKCDTDYIAERFFHTGRAKSSVGTISPNVSTNRSLNEMLISAFVIVDAPSTVNVYQHWETGILWSGFTWVEHAF